FDGPDREYVDGEIIERHLGSKRHSKAHRKLFSFLLRLSERQPLHVFSDLRVRMAERRYRVPDIAVYFGSEPAGNVPSTPPDVVVEVVSEDDRYVEIVEKLAQYRSWGVKHIWLVDPWTWKLSVYESGEPRVVSALELPEFGAAISAAEIFAD